MARLFEGYDVENLTMPVDREEFLRKARRRIFQEATVQERLEGLSSEQRLEGISPEQVFQKMTPDDREKLRRLLEEPPSP